MRTFDVTPDGKRIVFDRLRDNSDIVVIDRQVAAYADARRSSRPHSLQ
jgi:hypothetical protein